MLAHRRESEKIANLLSAGSDGENNIWIHIAGGDGSGKSRFIQSTLKKHLHSQLLLFHCDFTTFPYQTIYFRRALLKEIFRTHETQFQTFLAQYPLALRRQINRNFTRELPLEAYFQREPGWEYKLLAEFIDFLSRKQATLVILEGIAEIDTSQARLLINTLGSTSGKRQIVISSGDNELDFRPSGHQYHAINFHKLSVRETESLTTEYLSVKKLTARLITNHIYIKSEGREQQIKFMLEGYYSQLNLSQPLSVESSGSLYRIPPGTSDEEIFAQLLQQLPGEVVDVLTFLSRLDSPFPTSLLLHVLNEYECGRPELSEWTQKEFLQEATFLGESYVFIRLKTWKSFLRINTPVERAERILQSLRLIAAPDTSLLPLELSQLFLDHGDISTALKLAAREADFYTRAGEFHRALDKYAFLRRNLARNPHPEIISEVDLFRSMGELQKEIGLYENAFESFREMSECLQREEREEWIYATLQMADALFKMDSLSEARYLLQELKIKKFKSVSIRLFANVLMGELEENLGHPDYAIRHYEIALSMVSAAKDDSLKFRLYKHLKKHYLANSQLVKIQELNSAILSSLKSDAYYVDYLRLDLLKHYIINNDYRAAHRAIVGFRGNSNQPLVPELFVQQRLIIAEVYGYYSKWYLSRSYLRKLLEMPFIIPSEKFRLQILLKLGIVEKEMGYYGSALKLFEETLALAAPQRYQREAHQVKVHLGHIHLLAHSLIRAREYLTATLNWAEENQDEELIISAALLLSSYELQQERPEKTKQYLDKAKENINLLDTPIDKLNYFYYLAQYELNTGNTDKAVEIVAFWETQAQGIVKFENLVLWFSGKTLLAKGDFKSATTKLEAALARSRHLRLPHLEFQILKDLTELAHRQKDRHQFDLYLSAAEDAFQRALEMVNDEILMRQLQESAEHDKLLKLKRLGAAKPARN